MYSDTSLFSKKNIFNLLLLGIMALGIPLATNALKEAQILRSFAGNAEIKFVGDNIKLISNKPYAKSTSVTVELSAKHPPRAQTASANYDVKGLAQSGWVEKAEARHSGDNGWGDEFKCEEYGDKAGIFQWLGTTTYNGWEGCQYGRWTHHLRDDASGQFSYCNWTSEYTISCPGQEPVNGNGEIPKVPFNPGGNTSTNPSFVDCNFDDIKQFSCDAGSGPESGTWWCAFCDDGTPRCWDQQYGGTPNVCVPNATTATTGTTTTPAAGAAPAVVQSPSQSPNVCYVCDQSKYRENTGVALNQCSSECNGLSSETCHGGRGAWQGKECKDPKDPNDVALDFSKGSGGACASVPPISYLSPHSTANPPQNAPDNVSVYYLRSDSLDGVNRDSHGPLLHLELPSDYDRMNDEEKEQARKEVEAGTKAADDLVKLLKEGKLAYYPLRAKQNVDGEVAQYFLRSDAPSWAAGRSVQGGSERIMYPPNPVVNKLVELVRNGTIYVEGLCGGPTTQSTGNTNTNTAVFTTSYKIALSQAGLDDPAASVLPYNAHPTRTQVTLDADPNFRGTKTVWVRYSYSDNTKEDKSAAIEVIGQDPSITGGGVSCTTDISGTSVTVRINGSDFGPQSAQSKVTIGSDDSKKIDITSWTNNVVTGVIKNANLPSNTITATYPLVLTRGTDSAKLTMPTECALNVSQISVGGSLICRAKNSTQLDNVELTILENITGAKPLKETVSISKEGIVKGSSKAKLSKGQNYTVCLKAPGSLRKCFQAVGNDGTVVIKDSTLPVGDVFPVGGDCTINSLDASEVKRQWSISKGSGKTADFNQDGAVNSIDWTCMNKDFGQSCNAEQPVGVGTTAP